MRHLVHIAFVFLSFISQAQSSLLLKIYGLKNTNATFYLGDSIYLINAQNTSIYGFQPGDYYYRLQLEKQEIKDKIYLKKGINSLIIEVPELWVQLNRANVLGNRAKTILTNVIGTEIFAAKKTELIAPDSRTMNLANNNARQLFNRIPGLNIWENDASGLQINIGTRGLNPNRTSNLNTRQNGYDISADALGYPESYYVPPAEAIEQIRFVRGAAALQSGPHFGGLLDYQLKEKEESQLVVRQSLTGGSFKFVNSFTSIGGTKNKWSYYGFFQRKQGEGFLPNAKFHQNTGYVSLAYQISEKSKIKFQYTRMKYLAQQPGGLTDTEFEMNPYQAKRLRNWFDVDWNLYALIWNKRFSNQRRLNVRFFTLDASRKSVGDLSRPNRPDANRERDLIIGEFNNWGIESRFLRHYTFIAQPSTFLVGLRAYRGLNWSRQGFAKGGDDADFNLINPESAGVSDYQHPGYNAALFAENIFRLPYQISIIPGIRLEAIETNANGFYKNRLISGGRLIFEDTVSVSRSYFRQFPLLGLGLSKKTKQVEILANITQNYRSINFSDMSISNPNLRVDSNLKDESGFNTDITFRGYLIPNICWFDLSLFYLSYQDRIGISETVIEQNGAKQLTAFRTNIGRAYSLGIESYVRLSLSDLMKLDNSSWQIESFINYSYIDGRYSQGLSSFEGKKLEYVIPHLLRTGVSIRYKKWYASYQFNYQDMQYTDANNSILVSDATRGIVPSFVIHDYSLGYDQKHFQLKLSVNNIFNSTYFTRRALSYPGPGIITGQPRNAYVKLLYIFGN